MSTVPDSDISNAVKSAATRYEAPAALRGKVADILREPERPRDRARSWLPQQWLKLGAAFVCGLLASWTAVLLLPTAGADLVVDEVVASHVRSTMATHLTDVASTDRHTVKPWFIGKLDYSPPVNDLVSAGFPLVGGRLDYLDGRPVAALIYRHRLHTINVFVWPSGSGTASGAKFMARQGFNIAKWQHGQMQFWAVSDLNQDELATFARTMDAKAGD